MRLFLLVIFLFISVSSFSQLTEGKELSTEKYNHSAISDPYPVPAINFLSIDYQNIENGEIQIFNTNGVHLKKIVLRAKSGKIVLSAKNYSSGIYIYKIICNKKLLKTGKLIFD